MSAHSQIDDDDFVTFDDAPEQEAAPNPFQVLGEMAFGSQNVEAEEAILSCCFIDSKSLSKAFDAGISAKFFSSTRCQIIWEHMVELDKTPEGIDVITLKERLVASKEIDKIGGLSTIFTIQGRVETPIGLNAYIASVKSCYLRRLATRRMREAKELIDENAPLDKVFADIRKLADEAEQIAIDSSSERSRSIMDFGFVAEDDASVLLGSNRYLCRGGILATVSSSGMGKSSLSIQEAICYAIGLPFMGIKPNGILRSLMFQSEDDDGDIGEVVLSVVHKMGLTDEQRRLVAQNFRVVTDRVNMGDNFISFMRQECRNFKPDLVWINPLMAFFEGDITQAQDVSKFIRTGLGAANREEKWAYMVIHHTNKPQKDAKELNWADAMYGMAGSADIINAVRAIRILKPTDTEGEFVMLLAKRGKRAGVLTEYENEEGETTGLHYKVTTKIGMKHCEERFTPEGSSKPIPCIFWEPCDVPDEKSKGGGSGKGETQFDEDEILRSFHATEEEAMSVAQAYRVYQDISTDPVSSRTFRRRVEKLCQSNKILRRNADGLLYKNLEINLA